MDKTQLREWRKVTKFYCTQCDNPVKLKVGEIVIPHFAHEMDTSCSAAFSEGESTEHLIGKQQLFEFFERKVSLVKLEPYFKSLAQRPDLLITYNMESIPIEFQCSSIPIAQIESRTQGFNRAGMNPIWILNTPEKIKKSPQGVGIFYLSKFEETFINRSLPKNVFLLTYDPKLNQFHYVHSLLQIVGKRYIGIHRTLCMSKQTFPFARVKNPVFKDFQNYAINYRNMRKKFLNMKIILNKKGINEPFLRGCYELRKRPLELPSWIGVPVTSLNPFREEAVEWQLLFIHFIKKRGKKFSEITMGEMYGFVKNFEGASERQVDACFKYQYFLNSISVESLKDDIVFGDELLATCIENTLLANCSED